MRLLVIGAGASYAEAERAGLPEELRPPLMKDFAARMWSEYNCHYLLSGYLKSLDYEPGRDARETFIALEKKRAPRISIERFFEYAYNNRERVASGPKGAVPSSEYENLLYHGILNPLVTLLVQGLFRNGFETAHLPLAETMARALDSGDLVLNLNYDPIFEVAAEQAGHTLTFVPNSPSERDLLVCKPHGSMNLMVDPGKKSFYFARPLFAGSIQPSDGAKNYLGIVPPRLNKAYAQHPVARNIIEAAKPVTPSHVIFWGVGLTDSDRDLLDLFKWWCASAERVDSINPDPDHLETIQSLLEVQIRSFHCVHDWVR